MQVDLLIAEFEGAAAGAKSDRPHSQYAFVEGDRRVDVTYGQYQVIKPLSAHGIHILAPNV
jgi:hypothetical protein